MVFLRNFGISQYMTSRRFLRSSLSEEGGIPSKENAENLKDFMSISLVCSVYKIIAMFYLLE